jgi:hypothetical protein
MQFQETAKVLFNNILNNLPTSGTIAYGWQRQKGRYLAQVIYVFMGGMLILWKITGTIQQTE